MNNIDKMSDSEHSDVEEEKTVELAQKIQKRRTEVKSTGLDEAEQELLETNRQDRERMEEEIKELRRRSEKRKKEREVEEKRLAAERAAEDEKRKVAEETKRKQKEEEEQKKQKERAQKNAEFDKMKNPGKPNFVISKRGESTSGGDEEPKEGAKKSREQLEAEKRAALKQRITPLAIDGFDASGLTDKAKELHKLVYRLESEKYDLEKRFRDQQVDMMELAEKARQANKVGTDGLKRVKLGEGESDKIQEKYAGTPAKIEMFSKYERSKDKRPYEEKYKTFTGPQFILPPARIQAARIVKWNEGGMPIYEDIPGAEGHHGEE